MNNQNYGIFYITKNLESQVLCFFKLKQTGKINHENKEVRIIDINGINNFPETLKSKIKLYIENNFKKPYQIFYKTMTNEAELNRTLSLLRLTKENIENPAINFNELDLILNNLENIKLKDRYSKSQYENTINSNDIIKKYNNINNYLK